MAQEGKKMYHGWWIVITSMLIMALIFSPVVNLAGQFIKPISEEFGVGRAAVALQMTFGTMMTMTSYLFVGKLFVRFDMKKIMLVAIFMSIFVQLGYSFSTSIYFNYLCAMVSGIASALLTIVPISILINNWFGEKLRGRAMGIAMVGSGLGSMLLNPLVGFINETYNWRYSYRLVAGLMLIIVVPLVLKTIEVSPAAMGLTRIGDVDDGKEMKKIRGLTLQSAHKTSVFWIMGVAIILFSLVATVFTSNGAAYFNDIGFSPIKAATLISISAASLMVGKVVLGFLCDKIGAFNGAIISAAILLIGTILIILSSKTPVISIPAVIIFGFGTALPTVTIPLLASEVFGDREYGAIVGQLNVASSLGGALGPLMASTVHDKSGSYLMAWYAVIVIIATMITLTVIALKASKKVRFDEQSAIKLSDA